MIGCFQEIKKCPKVEFQAFFIRQGFIKQMANGFSDFMYVPVKASNLLKNNKLVESTLPRKSYG